MGAGAYVQRFSGRSDHYARARPGYPADLFDHLFSTGVLFPDAKVADLGSGTGIFTELLLDRGIQVYAVEPNQEMRSQAERRLAARKGFFSVDGTAERTGLPDRCLDAATAAQAFHWFDLGATLEEMRRVLRPGGQVVMVWNERDKERDDFHRGYTAIMDRYAREKDVVDALRQSPEQHFYPHGYRLASFHHTKPYDKATLLCLAVSSSYMPKEGEPGHLEMLTELEGLFEREAIDGEVRMHYVTNCFQGGVD